MVLSVTAARPTDPILTYAQDLKFLYRQSLPDEEKLPTSCSKYYIDLAVISSETVTRQEADEFTRKTLHGLSEEVMLKKTPIALQDVLKPGHDSKPVRCVLVEGAPGAGKSTLAWELCHKWEELESVKAFKLVVLVQLREKSAQEAQKLSDLFPRSRNTIIEDVLDSIGNGKGILLVLDGFDELPREQRQKNSVYIQLVKGSELPEATVIITSRPSVSADFIRLCRHSIDKRLEILGFTGEQVTEYSKSVFSESKEQCTAFLQYINGDPIIKGMMYLPLNAVIIAMIFKDNYGTDCPFPKTMTQLFDALTRSLIRRHLVHNRMITDDYCMPRPLQRVDDINKLRQLKLPSGESVADQFFTIARMAYDGLLDEKYIFNCKSEFDHLGLMKKTKSLDVSVGPNYSFCFLHLTLQEYMSAIHISLNSSVDVPPSIGDRDMVSRFMAGLCIHGNDFLYPKLLKSLGDMSDVNPIRMVHCVYECNNIVQNLVKDWFDQQRYMIVDSEFTFFEQAMPFDYYLTGHCISHIGGRWCIYVSSQAEVDLLVQGHGSGTHDSKGELQQLLLLGINIEHAEPLLKLCHNKLQHLELTNFSCSKSDVAILCKYNTPALKNITASCKNVNILLPVVFKPSSLESLTILSDFVSGTIGSHTVSLLKDNSNIKHLSISGTYLIPLAPALRDNTSLVRLEVKFTNEEANFLTLKAIIQSNRTLQQLEFTYRKPGLSQDATKAMVEIMDAAAYSPSIKEVTCIPTSSYYIKTMKVQHVCKKRSSSAGKRLLYSLENPNDFDTTHIQFTELD